MHRLFPFALLACRTPPELPPERLPPAAPATACVRFLGPPVDLAPEHDQTRHHPTVDVGAGGQIVVTWQMGKAVSVIATRSFTAALEPLGPEEVFWRGDARPTHPQIALNGDGGVIAWQDDATGAVRLAPVGLDGRRTGDPSTLVADDEERDGLYPDLSYGPDGQLAAMWFLGNDPGPAWGWAAQRGGRFRELQYVDADPRADLGSPATLGHSPDGVLHLAWTEQDTGWFSRESRVMVARVRPDGTLGEPRQVARGPGRWERTSMAFGDGGQVAVAWTQYPFTWGNWNAWLAILDPAGQPVRPWHAVTEAWGHMIDVDAAGDALVAAWEIPGDQQTDLVLQAFDLTTGAPRCKPTALHPPTLYDESRANVRVARSAAGVEGVVVWHVQTDVPGVLTVFGRRFRLMDAP